MKIRDEMVSRRKNGNRLPHRQDSRNFSWPPLPDTNEKPVWTGRGFRVAERNVPVLFYETGNSGWTDELTAFHEENAGANHPMDVASREYAFSQLKRFVESSAPVILEVGCSSGFFLRLLGERMPKPCS